MRNRRWIEVLVVILLIGAVAKWQAQAPDSPTPPTSTPSPHKATPEETPGPWDPFTETARQGILAAGNAATSGGGPNMDCYALVIGLRQADPRIDAYLKERNVSFTTVRKQLSGESEMAFTPDAKRAIELAFEECRSEKSDVIDSLHLFQGILRTDSPAAKSMAKAGVSVEDFKSWIKRRPDSQR